VSSHAAAAAPERGVRRAATAIFAATVLVAVGAFLITQRVKHLPTPIAAFEVGPSLRVPGGRERIALRLAAADTVDVDVLSGDGRLVATIARDTSLTAAQTLYVRWDGREGSAPITIIESGPHAVRVHAITLGPLAPAGEYHVTVRLQRRGETVPLPAYFVLERK
jgi:hypothetical protein